MRYQVFGRRTGLRVSQYALGTAGFGPGSEQAARDVFAAYTAAGGTTFDTSNLYQDGQSETVLGKLLGPDRDDYVVITKYSGTRNRPRPGTTGNSRKTMIASLEASLRRLGTGYVDVFMPHFPDGITPAEEILAGLDDLVRAGKVRYGGLSNFPAWRVAGAAVRADLRGLAPLAGLETEYSLAERSAERELLPMAEAHGLGVLLYSPLAGGLLTGKYRRGEPGRLSARAGTAEPGAVEGSAQRSAVVDAVLAVAGETGRSAAEVSLAWLRRRAALAPTALIPIVGPRSLAHLEQYLRSLDLELDEQHYQQLDKISAVTLGTPHEDVAGALSHGLDGDRTQLAAPTSR